MNKLKQLQLSSLLFLILITVLAACNKEQQELTTVDRILKTGTFPRIPKMGLDETSTIILGFPTAIRAYCGDYVNEVAFVYGNDEVFVGNNSGILSEHQLKKGEYIIGVSGYTSSSQFEDGTTTHEFIELSFFTNLQDTIQIQGTSNIDPDEIRDPFEYKVEEGNAIFCLYGSNNPSMASIGFFEDKMPDINVENNIIWLIAGLVILFILIIPLTILILKKKRIRF